MKKRHIRDKATVRSGNIEPRRVTLTPEAINAIEETLSNGTARRVEISTTREGVRVFALARKTVYQTPKNVDKRGADEL